MSEVSLEQTFQLESWLLPVAQSFTTQHQSLKPRLHLVHVARIQVVSICIHLYHLSPSTWHCILYRRQNCRHVSTCISYVWIKVARPGYLYAATCIWCNRGFTLTNTCCLTKQLHFNWVQLNNHILNIFLNNNEQVYSKKLSCVKTSLDLVVV